MKGIFSPVDRFDIAGRGVVLVGALSEGSITAGMTCELGGVTIMVKGVEVMGKKPTIVTVQPGEKPVNVGVVTNLTAEVVDRWLPANVSLEFTGPDLPTNHGVDIATESKGRGLIGKLFGAKS